MNRFLFVALTASVVGCWLTDEEALRRQREEYARKSSREKIVRVKTMVESGLNASLRPSKQAVTLKPDQEVELVLTISNLAQEAQLVRIRHSAPDVMVRRCEPCSQGLRLEGDQTHQVTLLVSLDWERLDLKKDYILLPFELVRSPGPRASE